MVLIHSMHRVHFRGAVQIGPEKGHLGLSQHAMDRYQTASCGDMHCRAVLACAGKIDVVIGLRRTTYVGCSPRSSTSGNFTSLCKTFRVQVATPLSARRAVTTRRVAPQSRRSSGASTSVAQCGNEASDEIPFGDVLEVKTCCTTDYLKVDNPMHLLRHGLNALSSTLMQYFDASGRPSVKHHCGKQFNPSPAGLVIEWSMMIPRGGLKYRSFGTGQRHSRTPETVSLE
ncbi:uncharacterized protein LAESUDRAFT_750101 [Laetiporus sulphureus 93-53]|uniref:Uncharacterized protein n=1 Tax=Laetiporus sulphureus 93-53 TaxID=1314785 RepID=A0A165E5J8_9APHY|nr:uncharacterized protein LAESUDRAFT_750101 [Laetiporus sulphureus 93-53]KZT06280.1 hypothetical protein LAESUDRAFT_750101 [Laetiporus sulphureus 93-53]